MILGCTHYPLLKETIKGIMGEEVTLIDAGAEAAVYAKERLMASNLTAEAKEGKAQYYVSDAVDGFCDLAQVFLEQEIVGQVQRIEIETY